MDERVKLRSDRLEWKVVDGEIVALDTEASNFLHVNQTGTLLWPAVAEGASLAQLESQLVQAFDVPPEQAAEDVAAFVASLREQDLLE